MGVQIFTKLYVLQDCDVVLQERFAEASILA